MDVVAALKRQAEELQYYAKLHRDGPLGGPYTGPIAVAPPSASAAVEGKPAKTVEHVQAPTINVMPRKSPALVAAPAKKPRLDAPKKPTPDGHQQPGVRTLTTAVASSQPKPKCTQPDSSKLTAAASAPTGKISPSVNAAKPELEEPPAKRHCNPSKPKPKCTQPDSSKLTAAASAPTGKISPSVNAATPKLEEPPAKRQCNPSTEWIGPAPPSPRTSGAEAALPTRQNNASRCKLSLSVNQPSAAYTVRSLQHIKCLPPFAPVLPAIQLPSHKEPTSGTRSKSVPLPKPSADPRGSKCVEPDVVPRKAHSQQSTPDNRLSKSESLPQLHQPLAEACIHGSGFGVLSVC